MGRVFSSVVRDYPELYASHVDQIKTLDPVYVSSALKGFASAIQQEKPFEPKPVLALALWVSEQPASSVSGAGVESTSDYSVAKHDVIELVEQGMKRHKLPSAESETIWKIIALLSEDEWGTLDYRDANAQAADAWFHSINYLRPKAVRAAVQFLEWTIDNSGQTKLPFSTVPEFSRYFALHTDPASEPCLSVRLIFGEKFPYLQAWDPAWGATAVDRIFPDNPDLRALRDVA